MAFNYFEDCKAAVKSMLYPDLQPGKILPEGKLEQFVDMMLVARDEWRNNVNRDALIRELKSEIDIGFSENYIKAVELGDERDHIEWLPKEKSKIKWKHWNRYKTYLQRKQPLSQVTNHDISTDDILSNLENPNRPGKWDTRGLVVGRVQMGKTSNYIGLVNKAFDAGYKRIIVLMSEYTKSALVLGAGGFIGSHMVKKLRSEGYWVRGVDLKRPEFSKTEANEFIQGDLRDVLRNLARLHEA